MQFAKKLMMILKNIKEILDLEKKLWIFYETQLD
jgi:hypothetical protein